MTYAPLSNGMTTEEKIEFARLPDEDIEIEFDSSRRGMEVKVTSNRADQQMALFEEASLNVQADRRVVAALKEIETDQERIQAIGEVTLLIAASHEKIRDKISK